MYGFTDAADDRPRPDDRDLHRQVLEAARPHAGQRLHLRARLDLEDAHRVGLADAVVDALVLEVDAREVDALALVLLDQLERLVDGGEHAEREEVDLDHARVVDGVLVPLAEDAALHRGLLQRHELDQRPRGDDHAADVLGDVAREAGDLLRRARPGGAKRRVQPLAVVLEAAHLRPDVLRRAALAHLRQPVELRRRQSQRLPDVADRAANAVGREASRRGRRGRARSARRRAGSASRGCRAGSRGRCRGPRPSLRSGSGRGRGCWRSGRCARGRSGSR